MTMQWMENFSIYGNNNAAMLNGPYANVGGSGLTLDPAGSGEYVYAASAPATFGASTALGADRPSSVTYTYFRDVIEADPATAALWTPGAVNAAQLQLNRTL